MRIHNSFPDMWTTGTTCTSIRCPDYFISTVWVTKFKHTQRFKLVLLFEFLPLLKNISEKISHFLLLLFLLVENYEVISKPQPKTIKPKFPMWEDTTDWR